MADCLETLEEINILNRETFIEAGGREFHYVPWANDSEGCVATLHEQVALALPAGSALTWGRSFRTILLSDPWSQKRTY